MENPEMGEGLPAAMPGEVFVLSRGGVQFSATCGRCCHEPAMSTHPAA